MPNRRLILPLMALALAACDRGEKVEAPTPAQTAQLDEADRMLDTMADRDAPREEENTAAPRHRADDNITD